MDDGYYWATEVYTGERDIVMVYEGRVFVFMTDMSFDVQDYKDYVPVESEAHP